MSRDFLHPLLALDLESVIVPEIWPALAARLGVPEIAQTTRDTGNISTLMQKRIVACRHHRIPVAELQRHVATLKPLPGAIRFLQAVRSQLPVVLISDVCFELVAPLLRKLGSPTILCHHLQSDEAGLPVAFCQRKPPGKGSVVRAFQGLDYSVLAIGDSFNDIEMLSRADRAVLLDPPANLVARYPRLPVANSLEAAAITLGIDPNPVPGNRAVLLPRNDCQTP